jgi:hypothetical protein
MYRLTGTNLTGFVSLAGTNLTGGLYHMTVNLADEISVTEMEENYNILRRGPPFISELPVRRHTSKRKNIYL